MIVVMLGRAVGKRPYAYRWVHLVFAFASDHEDDMVVMREPSRFVTNDLLCRARILTGSDRRGRYLAA